MAGNSAKTGFETGTALVTEYGTCFWVQRGRVHRDNNLPAIVFADGRKAWFKDGRHYLTHTPPLTLKKKLKTEDQKNE
jgi:hypothetical protein